MDTTDYAEYTSRIIDGEAQFFGDMFWPRIEPPLIDERFALLARRLPPGTIAAGVTAGWAWTGMGIPTPLNLVAKTRPAPSPLVRHTYKIRGTTVPEHRLRTRRGATALTREATIEDLWTCEATDDVAAAQLFWLTANDVDSRTDHPGQVAAIRRNLMKRWRAAYPWATRYTS